MLKMKPRYFLYINKLKMLEESIRLVSKVVDKISCIIFKIILVIK